MRSGLDFWKGTTANGRNESRDRIALRVQLEIDMAEINIILIAENSNKIDIINCLLVS